MKQLNEVFFAKEGEKGLNETSAAHLCAIANQVKAADEARLNNINFVNSTVSCLGGNTAEVQTAVGVNSEMLNSIQSALNRLGKMNSFISWFAEARNNLEEIKRDRSRISFETWCNFTNTEIPEAPSLPEGLETLDMDDAIAELSIKDRQTYLALEAIAAVYGKFIHPNKPLEEARRALHQIESTPYKTFGSGRDTVVTHYTASVNTEEVDKIFLHLQSEYRKIEQSLNHMKSDLRKSLEKKRVEQTRIQQQRLQEYSKARAAYDARMKELRLEYTDALEDEQERLSKVKFAIPKAFEQTIEFLNSLGK